VAASKSADPYLPFENTTKGVKSHSSRAWREVFQDDFKGDALDPGKWRTREQPPMGRRLCATPDADMVRVRDGQAVLGIERSGKASKTCPHGVFKNAMIGTGEVTKPGFATAYGLFAARLKFQSGRGQHGAFWLQGTGPNSAEIDTAEYYGEGRPDGGLSTLVHKTADNGTLISAGGPRPEVPKILGQGNTPANGWHVWSVEWSPKGYVFRLDDTVTMRTKRNVASADEFIVLSLLTSDWELPALNTAKSTMNVDWVRAWQH
jgi:beta-glucanase (GH16 family)